jgi:pimeloyl-ACP methyl ester carboxylesterase
VGAVAGVALWLTAVYALVFAFVHPARQPLSGTPAGLGLRYENVAFRAPDGTRIRGWFVPAKSGAPRGVILVCHGYPGNRADLLKVSGFLSRAGFAVLAFDFRSLGESDGDLCTIGYREVGDVEGAVAYLKTRSDTRNLPFGIYGTSMGGAVALQAAAKLPALHAVVADSPYASLDRAVAQRFRCYAGNAGGALLGVPARWMGDQMIGADSASVSPVAHVAAISPRPVFLIYGDADRLILPDDSRLLFARAGTPKQAWKISGAGHVGGYGMAGAEYERRVAGFFRRAFASPPRP